jgi:hypothetical protein
VCKQEVYDPIFNLSIVSMFLVKCCKLESLEDLWVTDFRPLFVLINHIYFYLPAKLLSNAHHHK